MSSPSRRELPEMVQADAEAGALLATDADRAREARDWRTAAAGGPPAVIARDTTPERWDCHTVFGMKAAREIARIARNNGQTPSEYVRELVLADIVANTGIPPEELRENLSVFRKNRARALRI